MSVRRIQNAASSGIIKKRDWYILPQNSESKIESTVSCESKGLLYEDHDSGENHTG